MLAFQYEFSFTEQITVCAWWKLFFRSCCSELFCASRTSILGPQWFVIYTSQVCHIIQRYNLQHHVYADDTQIYVSFDASEKAANDSAYTLEACIIEIRHRMRNNYLKLNDSKTEFILTGSRQKLDKIKDLHIKIGDSIIAPVRQVQNLGVIMDDSMTLTSPVSSTVKSASFQIRNLGQIRKFSLLKPLNIWFMPLLPPVWTWEIHSFATFQRNRFIACSWNKIWPHVLPHAPSLLNT